MKKTILFLSLVLPMCLTAQSDKSIYKSIKSSVSILADDEMEGRGTGTEGERKAGLYVIEKFRKLGLKPMGTANQFTQPFIVKQGLQILETTQFKIGDRRFEIIQDFFPLPYSNQDSFELKRGTGQCLLVDIHPLKESLKTNPHTDLQELIYQRSKLLADKYPGHLIIYYQSQEAIDVFSFDEADKHERLSLPILFAKKSLVDHLRLLAGKSVSIVGQFKIEPLTINTSNIVGVLDNGANHTIVIGAHLDHLGWGGKHSLHALKEKIIHNGADDNASGVSMMLTLANLLQQKAYQSSNYLFIAFSAEELGLLGSKYFVEHPTIDLKIVRYMINLDMVGRLNDSTHALTVGGFGTSPIWSKIIATKENGLLIKIDSSGAGPSDHTSFYRKNIPVLFFFTGVHGDYHKPSDDVEKINLKGMVTITRFIQTIVFKSLGFEKIPFLTTKENAPGKTSFKVSLGIMPDYAFDGEGLRIDGVSENKPAQKAGIMDGDILIKLNEISIKNINQYMQSLAVFKKGDQITVTIIRNGKTISMPITF